MEMMAVDPVRRVIAPRFLSAFLSMPLLAAIFSAIGVYGGWFIGVGLLGVDDGAFWSQMQDKVDLHGDIYNGVIKSIVFGFVVGWLRTEEACLLTVPREKVKKMPKRVQELIGYKAHEGIGPGAKRQPPLGHLVQAARNQRDPGIGAEPEAVADPGADRHDVFYCRAHFHADDVGCRIGAEFVRGNRRGNVTGELFVSRCDRHRRREPAANLVGKGRSGKHCHGNVFTEHFTRNFVRQLAGVEFKALGGPAQPGTRHQQRLDAFEYLAESMAGHDDEYIGCLAQRFGQARLYLQCRGELRIRQVLCIDAVALQ